jgi:hypothetical protein
MPKPKPVADTAPTPPIKAPEQPAAKDEDTPSETAPEPEPEIIPIGTLVEEELTGYRLIVKTYNESSNTYECYSSSGRSYMGRFKRDELMIIHAEPNQG